VPLECHWRPIPFRNVLNGLRLPLDYPLVLSTRSAGTVAVRKQIGVRNRQCQSGFAREDHR
jgi:hypothetical protein